MCYREQHKIDGNTRRKWEMWEENAQADIELRVFFSLQTRASALFYLYEVRVGLMGTIAPLNLLVRSIAFVHVFFNVLTMCMRFLWKLYIHHNLFYCPSLRTKKLLLLFHISKGWRFFFSAFFTCCMEIKWTILISGQIACHWDSKMTKHLSPMDEIPNCSFSISHIEKTITEIFVDGL